MLRSHSSYVLCSSYVFTSCSDVGYKLVQGISCIWDTSSGLSPTPIPSYCPAGSTYSKSKGYETIQFEDYMKISNRLCYCHWCIFSVKCS